MRDMTQGSATEHLWKYALPLVLGNWFQMGYNIIDSIIVGKFISTEALAAVGIAAPIMNLVILAITGVCMGAGVLMSEFFGAKNYMSLRRQFSTTLLSGAALSVLVAVAGILFTEQMMVSLAVPNELYGITTTYLRITFLGAPFTFFYNALSVALKSVGDSKTPLKFLMFASILNGVLDIIFIGGFHMGIVCSATTTVIAQMLSAALAANYLLRKLPELCPKKKEWVIDKELLKKTWKLGSVTALQQAVQPIGKLLIQGQVNALGVTTIAAFNAVTRVEALALTPEQSISHAITTYVAQNRGAKKTERIKHGFGVGMAMEMAYWIFIGTVVFLFREPIVALFVEGDAKEEVIAIGAKYLAVMAVFYFLPGMTNGVQGFFRGFQMFKITLLGTIIQTSLRVVATIYLTPTMGITGIAYACAFGWIVMLLVELPIMLWRLRRN